MTQYSPQYNIDGYKYKWIIKSQTVLQSKNTDADVTATGFLSKQDTAVRLVLFSETTTSQANWADSQAPYNSGITCKD